MRQLPRITRAILILTWSITASSHALEIRNYSAAKHNRLIHFPGKPVYAFQTPALNPSFSPSAELFLGIGWPTSLTDWTRQMALISPRHFVFATHYPLEANWRIAFLDANGKQHTYGIKRQDPILNPQGQNTDLMLCTLTDDIPDSTGITAFPVLEMARESDYVGKEMIVCGSFVRAGKMTINGFTTLVNDPGFDTTRFAYFDYHKSSGGKDDCNYQGGDSGAPSFIIIDGQATLIGTASGQDELPDGISRNYINFIPAYLTELDHLMENEGYHVKRFHPSATTVSCEIISGDPLRRMKPASLGIKYRNTGEPTAHNLTMTITFSAPPATVSGTGWICEATSPLVWKCRRGGLASSAESILTASWANLPDSKILHVSISKTHDGEHSETQKKYLTIMQ